MDINKFRVAMKLPPSQDALEWQLFFEFIEAYFKNRKIINPVIVEIGTRCNHQKAFYVEILNAAHIGIDISNRFATPDILGESQDPRTFRILKQKLNGRPVNLLFIDGNHSYEAVKSDYETYGSLVKDIIVFHDISARKLGVYKLWDKLTKHDDNKSAKRSIRIGYGTGLIMLTEGEKIYERFENRDKYY